MKKLVLLSLSMISFFGAFAQTGVTNPTSASRRTFNSNSTRVFTKPNGLTHLNSSSRSVTISQDLYYPGIEEAYSTDAGINHTPNSAETINKYITADTSHRFESKWGLVFFDNIFNLDSSTTFPLLKYDLSEVTMTIDSVYTQFVHTNVSGANDTIILRLYDYSTVTTINTDGVVGTLVWSDTIITNTSLSPDPNTFSDYTFYPGLTLAKGKTVVGQIDYLGPLADQFLLRDSYSDHACGFTVDLADTAYVSTAFGGGGIPNSVSRCVVGTGAGTASFFFSNQVGFDINGDGNTADCENYLTQNLWIIPSVTLTIDLSASPLITDINGNAKSEFCPGEIANVNLNVAGNSGPYTVSWSPTTGVDDPTSNNVVITVPNTTTTYTVTITEGASVINKTVIIKSNGINVNAGADQTISCGTTANLLASSTGVTAGASYKWSNSGPTTAAYTGVTAGIYSVTVTNTKGCTATDVVEVKYPGVTQSVGFSIPNPVCVSATYPATFPNTSAKKSGWNWTWTNVTGGGITSFLENGQFLFAAAGSTKITLEADSAGCKFLTTAIVNVKAASDPLCAHWSVENIDFANNVTIFPNPNTGSFELNVEGIDGELAINVFDMNGKVVYTENTSKVSSFQKSMNLSSLAGGVYYVKVSSGENSAVKKLVIN